MFNYRKVLAAAVALLVLASAPIEINASHFSLKVTTANAGHSDGGNK